MKPTLFNCHKYTSLKQNYQVNPLMCTVSLSMFWLLGVNEASIAQVNSLSGQAQPLDLGELLPVPQYPPSGQKMERLQTLPSPPGAIQPDGTSKKIPIAVVPQVNPLSKAVQQTPTDEIQQLENALIEGKIAKGTPKAISGVVPLSSSVNVQSAIGGDDFAQAISSPSSNTTIREFTSPTFNNQFPNSQSQSAPLPPLPKTATPEFNQSFNSQGVSSVSSQSAPPPTFNQLLNSQAVSSSSQSAPPPTFNQLLNSQTVSPPLPQSTSSTFNQSLNSQTVPPLPTATAVPTSNQLLNCEVVTPPSSSTTGAPTFNQLLNCQVVNSSPPSTTTAPSFNEIPNTQSFVPPPVVNTAPSFDQIANTQSFVPPPVVNTAQREEFPTDVPIPQRNTLPPGAPEPANRLAPLVSSTALREPSLQFQGVYITQGDEDSARARLTGVYPLTRQVLVGATLDWTTENSNFDDSRNEGLNINELYVATSLSALPNLRFVLGQIDLTSYFDRNSFAKDGATQFFNPVFQTNPALASTAIAPRPGFLVNWTVTDNVEAKAAVYSSSDSISNFALDAFAGEVGIRYGNAIIRGTYATGRDAGNRDSFAEAFSIARNDEGTRFGPQEDDREEAYGINAEVYIPELKLGLFGRYGRYENRDLGEGGDTYVFGATVLDLFTGDDRLGLAYGRSLSNDSLRRGDKPDVLELYYDFPILPYLRLGFSVQGRENFEETVLGIRVRSEFDILSPTRKEAQ
jgi:hypothetical protein